MLGTADLVAQQQGPAPRAPRSPKALRSPRALALTNVTMLDIRDGSWLPNQTVVVTGTRITALGPTETVRLPPRAQVVAAEGKYLIPGLWDMHAHVMDCWDNAYPLFIANGITGIRDPAEPFLEPTHRFRREIAAGQRVGPRQLLSGPPLGYETDGAFGCSDEFVIQRQVRTPAEARRLVDSLQAAGADFIKVRFDGGAGVDTTIVRTAYFAVAAEARRVGIRLEGHNPVGVTLVEASDSGQRVVDHGFREWNSCYTRPDSVSRRWPGDTASAAACAELAAHLRRTDTWWVPTLLVYLANYAGPRQYIRLVSRPEHERSPRNILPDKYPGNFFALAETAGVPLLIGTDRFPYGFALHDELEAYVHGGLTPLAALQAATLNPAKYLHATDSLGTIAPGKLADLVLLDQDPLRDIQHTRTIRAVVANGRYFDRAALDSLLVVARQAADRCSPQVVRMKKFAYYCRHSPRSGRAR